MSESNTLTMRKMSHPGNLNPSSHFEEWMRITTQPKPALLVDDSKAETELIVKLSDDFNIQWEVCWSPETALDRLCYKKYQLVVLDLKLNSAMSGIETFRQIKRACPMCPVLILSGYVTNEAITEITKIGFAMFAQKPQVFDSNYFQQLFLALNIPKKGQGDVDPCALPPGDKI